MDPAQYIYVKLKMQYFIDFFATNKIDNLTCVDYHETHQSILLYFCGAIGLFFLYNKQMLGNMKFISRVEQDMSLVRFARGFDHS